MYYGDDWRKVALAQHVNGRSEKDCIKHFIKLPFGEEFIGKESGDVDYKYISMKNPSGAESKLENIGATSPSKRMRLTPLADASNPIMARAAFLSALAGVEIAEVAARAAVTTLLDVDNRAIKESLGHLARNITQQEAEIVSNCDTTQNVLERASVDANSLIEKEELDIEKAASGIVEVQTNEIQDKIVQFESLDLHIEKEWKQLAQVMAMFFVDQLSVLFHKTSARKTGDHIEENVKTDVS